MIDKLGLNKQIICKGHSNQLSGDTQEEYMAALRGDFLPDNNEALIGDNWDNNEDLRDGVVPGGNCFLNEDFWNGLQIQQDEEESVFYDPFMEDRTYTPKDDAISENHQGNAGDCWLLSAINSLSYTKVGSKVIQNALEYHDGYTTVHFADGIDCNISDDEVEISKAISLYSSGDTDMLIFELAFEKLIDGYTNGTISLQNPFVEQFFTSSLYKPDVEFGETSITEGNPELAYYFLTGQMPYSAYDKEEMNAMLYSKQFNDNEGCVICATYIGDKDVPVDTIPDGIQSNHTYTVKRVENGKIIIVNPWDSSEELEISRPEFLSIFTYLTCCNFY